MRSRQTSPRPSLGRPWRHRFLASLERMEARQLLTTIFVNTTGDGEGADGSATLSLRQAIEISNGTLAVGSLTAAKRGQVSVSATAANQIEFAIPASTAAMLASRSRASTRSPRPGRITLGSPLPAITHQVTIDGFTAGRHPVPYRYPSSATTPMGDPVEISSSPSTVAAAIDGNNAIPRVIVDGSRTGGATGFVLDASHSILRGLIIDGFGVGVSVPNPGDVGDLIQGNDIGKYRLFPVDPDDGLAADRRGAVAASPAGATRSRACCSGSTNATVGGVGAAGRQRHHRQRPPGRLDPAGGAGQPGHRQPDRHRRPPAIGRRLLHRAERGRGRPDRRFEQLRGRARRRRPAT